MRYYRNIDKTSILYLLLISMIAVQWHHCQASSHQNDEEETVHDLDLDETSDMLHNISEHNRTESLSMFERKKRASKLRHRTRDTRFNSESTTTPAPEKLTEREIIQKILLTNEYDWRVRPVGLNNTHGDTGGPVKVTVNIYLRSISKIDDVNMEYSAQFTFRETWIDRRLAYERMKNASTTVPSFIVLALSDSSQQIWMPDTFFQNEKEARKHMIDKPNVLIRIYPNGEILYSVRLSMVLSCPMSLEYYPLDEQQCLIELASYAYTTDDIVYEWKNDTPVQQKDGLGKSLPSFELQAVKTSYCTSTTNTGQYSCLRTTLILRREFSYYLLQLYIPSFMLVIVSWVSFWLDKDSVPARVTLGVTTLLTMTTQSSGINAKLPPVSYTKAIDVWIGVCLAFIFGALLEFALVNYAARKDIMRNVSGVMRRGRRPGINAGAPQTAVDPSLESLTGGQQQEQPNVISVTSPPPPSQPPSSGTLDDQCNYNTFMMNPLMKNPSPMMHRHQQDILPLPARNTYHTLPRHQQQQQQQPPQYSNYPSSPLHSMALLPTQQQAPTGSNGRLAPNQTHHNVNHQNLQLPQQHLPPHHQQQRQQQQQQQQQASRHRQRSCMDLWLSKYKERSKRIDVVSRLVFPVGFFIFNCVYWTVYML